MSNFSKDNFISKYAFYQKVMYIMGIVTIALCGFFTKVYPTNTIISLCLIFALFFMTDTILYAVNYMDSSMMFMLFRFIELSVFLGVQAMANKAPVIVVVCTIFIILESVEYVLYKAEYDTSMVNMRRYSILVPMIVNLFIVNSKCEEYVWLVYMAMHVLSLIIVVIITEWFVRRGESYEKEISKLKLEMSRVEDNNTKLIEYQERIKSTNDQINYQKIDLIRVNKELEQINLEIESQSEIMKYMASTFDIPKCINFITDAVIEVKKAKLCAVYIEKDVYMNQFGTCIVKTNYSSMQRRLNKEIDSIFERVSSGHVHTKVFKHDMLKGFKFIGDANINAVAILPFYDGKKIYGMMVVGSDEEDFFDKSMSYYENCIVEFNVAMNSTKMYLAMEDMARKDGLTGIYNRIYFKKLFADAIKSTKLKKKSISAALFDIDKFKKVNDTYGHLAGDKVIQMVASLGKKYAEEHGGFACRYGGEEFVIVLPGYDKESALAIMEELHKEIKSTPVYFNDKKISVNVCLGLTTYPELCSDPELLVSRADKAMYYGKKHGRGRLVVDSELINDVE